MSVVIETTIGDFTVDLYTDDRPQTCRNFLKLCKVKYYNWNLFHTVQSNFIAQVGDPTGTGRGGESVYGIVLGEEARYYEGEQMPKIKHDKSGLLSMVNCGNNMLGSQFFITLAPHLQSLDGEHCVFGEIVEGLDIVLKLNETICDVEHRPYQDIRISHTVVLEDPFQDPRGLFVPERSPQPTKEALMSDRIGADEVIDDTAGMTSEEIVEMQKDKEAKARATILEIVGDIPDADMAPPENVLFICKLNPVTTDDDLEIIFSRFGKIVGCEVIRDRQSGDSLQYAFIEFAERKSCEEAYFKMDNVLIDDRRIHVDFSQSVAKMRWRGKGKGIKYLEEKDTEINEQDIGEKRRHRRIHQENSPPRQSKRSADARGEHRKFERRKSTKSTTEQDYSRNERRRSHERKGTVERERDRQRGKDAEYRQRHKGSYQSDSRRDKETASRGEKCLERYQAQTRNYNRRPNVEARLERNRARPNEDGNTRSRVRDNEKPRHHGKRKKKKHGRERSSCSSSSSSSSSETEQSSSSAPSTSSSSSSSANEYQDRKKKRVKSRQDDRRKISLKYQKKKRKNG